MRDLFYGSVNGSVRRLLPSFMLRKSISLKSAIETSLRTRQQVDARIENVAGSVCAPKCNNGDCPSAASKPRLHGKTDRKFDIRGVGMTVCSWLCEAQHRSDEPAVPTGCSCGSLTHCKARLRRPEGLFGVSAALGRGPTFVRPPGSLWAASAHCRSDVPPATSARPMCALQARSYRSHRSPALSRPPSPDSWGRSIQEKVWCRPPRAPHPRRRENALLRLHRSQCAGRVWPQVLRARLHGGLHVPVRIFSPVGRSLQLSQCSCATSSPHSAIQVGRPGGGAQNIPRSLGRAQSAESRAVFSESACPQQLSRDEGRIRWAHRDRVNELCC